MNESGRNFKDLKIRCHATIVHVARRPRSMETCSKEKPLEVLLSPPLIPSDRINMIPYMINSVTYDRTSYWMTAGSQQPRDLQVYSWTSTILCMSTGYLDILSPGPVLGGVHNFALNLCYCWKVPEAPRCGEGGELLTHLASLALHCVAVPIFLSLAGSGTCCSMHRKGGHCSLPCLDQPTLPQAENYATQLPSP